MCAGAGTSVFSRLSVNSSNHSGLSRKRSSKARVMSFFWFMFLVVGESRQFPGAGSSFRTGAGLEDAIDEPAVWKTNWHQNLSTIQEQQEVRICTFCKFSSLVWSTVAFDHWSTHRYNRALRRAFQARELQACHRVFAPSRRDQDRTQRLVLPRLFALLHSLLPPL